MCLYMLWASFLIEYCLFLGKVMDPKNQIEIEAAVFRRMLNHFQQHTEVQNIDLMILADFCRNCLAKWYVT